MKVPREEDQKSFSVSVKESGVEVDKDRLKRILDGDVKELNTYADKLAQRYVKGKGGRLSTSQLRSVVHEIQRMREFDETKLQLLRLKLAYAAGRHGGMVRDFREMMETLIGMVNGQNYKFFRSFVEAILAYHTYHTGKGGSHES